MPQGNNDENEKVTWFNPVDEDQLDEDIDIETYELNHPEVPFEHSLEAIQENALAPNDMLGFSDISRKQVHELRAVWKGLAEEHRVTLAELALMVSRDQFFSDFGRFFLTLLDDESVDVRLNAATGASLSEIPELIKPLYEMAEGDGNLDVREAAIHALAPHVVALDLMLVNDRKDEERLLRLKEWARDGSQPAEIRAAALQSYSHNTSDDDIDAIIESFVGQEDDTLQLGAMRAMAVFGAGKFTRFLERQLQGNDVDAREAAVAAMGMSGDEAVVPMLTMAARTDTESVVREAAYMALANIATDPALKALTELRKNASDDEIEIIDGGIQYITDMNELEADVLDMEPAPGDEDF